MNNFAIENESLIKYTGTEKRVVVPRGIVAIGHRAFAELENLEEVIISEGIKEISTAAFIGCKNLRKVILPSTIAKIGELAFWGCKSLQDINEPAGDCELGNRAFYDCPMLARADGFALYNRVLYGYYGQEETITLPHDLVRIDSQSFTHSSIKQVRKITLPSSMNCIPDSVFDNMSGLEEVNIPDNVEFIASNAFGLTDHLKTIVLPETIHAIFPKAFWYAGIEHIELPQKLTEISMESFRGSKLEEITLPKGIKQIHKGAFYECNKLKRVILSEGLEKIGNNAFGYCRSLEEINIPNTAVEFGKAIFEKCEHLKRFTFPGHYKIETDTFGETLPTGLIECIDVLEPNMVSAAYQKYVLTEFVWSKLSLNLKLEFFIKRNTKGCLQGYNTCIKDNDINDLGCGLLKRMENNRSKSIYQAIYNYISLFYNSAETSLLQAMFNFLKEGKNIQKLVAELESKPLIIDAINRDFSMADQTIEATEKEPVSYNYAAVDQISDSFYSSIEKEFDINEPFKTKMKKTIVSLGSINVTVKFENLKNMNMYFPSDSKKIYDPEYIISNGLYEEKTGTKEIVTFSSREMVEYSYIQISNEADFIQSERFTHRIKIIAKMYELLKDEKILAALVETMPKKKNGTLYAKRITPFAITYVINRNFSIPVLCAKATKDTEIEVCIKWIESDRMDKFKELVVKADERMRYFFE